MSAQQDAVALFLFWESRGKTISNAAIKRNLRDVGHSFDDRELPKWLSEFRKTPQAATATHSPSNGQSEHAPDEPSTSAEIAPDFTEVTPSRTEPHRAAPSETSTNTELHRVTPTATEIAPRLRARNKVSLVTKLVSKNVSSQETRLDTRQALLTKSNDFVPDAAKNFTAPQPAEQPSVVTAIDPIAAPPVRPLAVVPAPSAVQPTFAGFIPIGKRRRPAHAPPLVDAAWIKPLNATVRGHFGDRELGEITTYEQRLLCARWFAFKISNVVDEKKNLLAAQRIINTFCLLARKPETKYIAVKEFFDQMSALREARGGAPIYNPMLIECTIDKYGDGDVVKSPFAKPLPPPPKRYTEPPLHALAGAR